MEEIAAATPATAAVPVTTTPVLVPEEWDFPSDHLPVVAQLGLGANAGAVAGGGGAGDDVLLVASFNILNEAYKPYLVYGSGSPGQEGYVRGQQLGNSPLFHMNESQRRDRIVEIVANRGVREEGVAIFALQECCQKTLDVLRLAIDPDRTGIISTSLSGKDHGVIIYDSTRLKIVDQAVHHYRTGTTGTPANYIQRVLFEQVTRIDNGHYDDDDDRVDAGITVVGKRRRFIFINTHVPFMQSSQLVDHLLSNEEEEKDHRHHYPVVVAGDLNLGYNDIRPESCIRSNLLDKVSSAGFRLVENIAEYSHINTEPVFDLFDHILVSGEIEAKPSPEVTLRLRCL